MRGERRAEVKVLIGAIVAAWAVLVILGAARAQGDGLPVPGGIDTTAEGVLTPDGEERIIAIPHDHSTLLLRLNADNGVVRQTRWIAGTYVVPAVSLDGYTDGISLDGRRLVLISPRAGYPRRSTSLAVVDPRELRLDRTVDLRGDFSFDAISPDGRSAYLVQYRDPRDPSDYSLRRLDLPAGRLAPGSLLPDNEPDEEMRGFPMTRVTGSGGDWEYTLYDGGATYGARHPGTVFVHALDTARARTLCIDLEWIAPRAAARIGLQMSADGSEVEVLDPRRGVVGRIDVATGEAREVSEPLTAPAAAEEGGGGAGGALKLAGAALLLGGVGLLGWGLRRRAGGRAETSPAG